MEMNKTIAKGKWNEIKGEVRKAWGKITDDELEQTKGDLVAIKGLIQQRYGESQADYGRKLDSIFSHFKQNKDEAISTMKDQLRSNKERMNYE